MCVYPCPQVFSATANSDGTDIGSDYESLGHVVFQSYLAVQVCSVCVCV
jgi:hypothetical protein